MEEENNNKECLKNIFSQTNEEDNIENNNEEEKEKKEDFYKEILEKYNKEELIHEINIENNKNKNINSWSGCTWCNGSSRSNIFIHDAAFKGHLRCINFILKSGDQDDPEIKEYSKGWNALFFAIKGNQNEAFKLLIDFISINCYDKKEISLLRFAIRNDRFNMAKRILKREELKMDEMTVRSVINFSLVYGYEKMFFPLIAKSIQRNGIHSHINNDNNNNN